MCGRFAMYSESARIARRFEAEDLKTGSDTESVESLGAPQPSWNVAPSQLVFTVTGSSGHRELEICRWGLVPPWAKDLSIGSRMINARSERVSSSPAFHHAFQRQRCIIPINGFYEWQKTSEGLGSGPHPGRQRKQPYYMSLPDNDLLALAGIWEIWTDPQDPQGNQVRTCSILTRESSGIMLPIHDRMPLILNPVNWDCWLAPEPLSALEQEDLLSSLPPPIVATPVSTAVNSPRNNGSELIRDFSKGIE